MVSAVRSPARRDTPVPTLRLEPRLAGPPPFPAPPSLCPRSECHPQRPCPWLESSSSVAHFSFLPR